jgi:hypothetical protein
MKYTMTYLVPICQAFPRLDKSFSHNILIICSGITVIIQNIRYIFVHVKNERSEFRPHELIEQLLYSGLPVVVSALLWNVECDMKEIP